MEPNRDVMTLDNSGREVKHAGESRSAAMTPMDMIQVAVQGGQSLDIIDKLMNLQERWEANQGRKAFDQAIAAAKADIRPVIKNKVVDFTNKAGQRTHYQYEDLAEIARTVDPILGAHGLSYRYRTKQDGNRVSVTCVVSHKDGYSEETSLSAANDESGNKNSIQSIGSAITFLQRYTLKAALGLAATVDDDGRKSQQRDPEPDLISADELKILRDELDARDGDVRALCEHLKLEALADLRKSEFSRILGLIKKKPLAKGEGK
jgi:hypothetical protein